jgi:hypothetical protein
LSPPRVYRKAAHLLDKLHGAPQFGSQPERQNKVGLFVLDCMPVTSLFGGIVGSSMMAIIVTCTCGKQFKVKEELAGKRGKCAACGRVLSVPTLAPSSSTPAAHPGPAAKALASSAQFWIALAAGGACLTGVVVIVAVFPWGGGAGNSAVAPQPNSGIHNGSLIADAPASLPGPAKSDTQKKSNTDEARADSDTAKAKTPAAKADHGKIKAETGVPPMQKIRITDAVFDKILRDKMTEAEVTELLGTGQISGRPTAPKDMRELIWKDEHQNSVLIQFEDGKARGGKSTIHSTGR